jgi:hypothetical protein
MRATCAARLILIDLITLTILVKNTNYEALHCVILSATRALLGPAILLDTLFLPSICVLPQVIFRDSHI